MKTGNFTFENKGARIFTYYWLPENTLKGVILLAHGMAEHYIRYAEFADFLVKRGYGLYVHDQRGHGKSLPPDGQYGYLADRNGWELLVDDLHHLITIIKEKHIDTPFFLMGHSMGSSIVRTYFTVHDEDITGAVILGSSNDPGINGYVAYFIARVEALIRGPKAVSPLMDWLIFNGHNKRYNPSRTKFDWLTRDEKKIDEYINDPLCGMLLPASFYRELTKNVKALSNKKSIARINKNLPFFFISGELDPVGGYTKNIKEIIRDYKNAGINDVTSKVYNDCRHELLNELNRDEVYSDIVSWMNQYC